MLPSAVSDSRVHNILPNKIETDFQFSRASAATRVNHQGLIEDVGYFGPELVQNGNFSELGPELVTNGGFDTDSNWTKGTGWSINDGKATYQGTISSNLRQSNVLVSGKTHKLVFEVTSNTSDGNLKLAGETVSGGGLDVPETVGVHTVYFVATGSTTNFAFRVTNNTTGVLEIDNVSVKQVDPNDRWTLGTGWGYGDGVASRTSQSGSSLLRSNSFALTVGKTYKCTMTVSNYSSGGVRFSTDNFGFTVHSANGTYTEILTSTGTVFNIKGNAAFAGSVTDISVVEVIGDKPRLDYDPTNPTCPHLLLEPQSTNKINFSEDFSKWSLLGATTVEYVSDLVNPDGSVGGYKISGDGIFVNNGSGMTGDPTSTSGRSIYARTVSGTGSVQLLSYNGNTNNVFTVNENWQRFELNSTAVVPANFYAVDFRGASTTISEIYLFAAQADSIDIVTSYIPTAGAAETRVAETCNNAGNADTFNSAEGVLYCEASTLINGADCRITISDGSISNRVSIEWDALPNTIKGFMGSNGLVQTSSFNQTQDLKIALHYKVNDFKMFINGAKIAQDTNVSAQVGLNTLSFDNATGTNDFYGKVKALATYNRALTDTELYTITSTQYSAYSGMVAALGNYTIPC